jgi:predicted MFS family arabinose efflux permease
MAVVLAGLTLAFIVGIPLGSIIGANGGWRSTFLFAGCLALVAALVTLSS